MSGDALPSELSRDGIAGRHVGESEREVQETRQMHLLGDRSRPVRQEEDAIIPVVSIPSSRLAAHVGHGPRQDDVFHFQAAQHGLEISVIEGRVPVLEDDFLARRKASMRRLTVGRIATPPHVNVGQAASKKNHWM